jgi:hypothetical protein
MLADALFDPAGAETRVLAIRHPRAENPAIAGVDGMVASE